MRKIRVLIANRPRLMRELVVATISDQPDIEIVGVLEDQASILGMVEQSFPAVLIIALDRTEDRPTYAHAAGSLSAPPHTYLGGGA